MGALVEDIEGRLAAEMQMRRGLVLTSFPYMDADQWNGVTQEGLVDFVETLHRKLVELDPQELRDPDKLGELKDKYIKELPVLGKEIEGGMSAYDLLLKIAEGVENFSVPPLSAHRAIPLR